MKYFKLESIKILGRFHVNKSILCILYTMGQFGLIQAKAMCRGGWPTLADVSWGWKLYWWWLAFGAVFSMQRGQICASCANKVARWHFNKGIDIGPTLGPLFEGNVKSTLFAGDQHGIYISGHQPIFRWYKSNLSTSSFCI